MSSLNKTLKLVQIVFRHGDKGNEKVIGNEFSSLLQRGRRRLESIGHFIKQRYSGFLSEDIDEVGAKSSAVDRCVDSAVHFLKGAYPVLKNSNNDEVKKFIETKPVKCDQLLFPYLTTIEDDEEVKQFTKDAEDYIPTHKDVFEVLKGSKNSVSLNDFISFRNQVQASIAEGTGQLPLGVETEMVTKIEDLNSGLFLSHFGHKQCRQQRAGPLFNELTRNMLEASQNTGQRKKLYLYCTHEFMMSLLQLILDVFERFPNFGECLIFELHHINGQHQVVIYRLNTEVENKPGPVIQVYPIQTGNYEILERFVKKFDEYLTFENSKQVLTEQKTLADIS